MDLTHAAAGPWTTMLLGALGAEIYKIEPPDGDIGRLVPPPQNGLSAKHIHCSLNKKNAKLNLKDERDKDVARRLAATADIVVENMRPGTAARLGFGYEDVRQLNERAIYCSITGYGTRGPLGKEGGVDTQIQAFCGWCSINGEVGSQGEMFRHFAHIDLNTATYATSAIMMALYAREFSGKGQLIEVPMFGAAMALQSTRLAEYFATGEVPVPLGSAASTTAPHEAFVCQDGEYIAIGIENDAQWQALCRALKRTDLVDDERFRTNPDRVVHRAELTDILGPIFQTKAAQWWAILGGRFEFPAARVLRNQFDLLRYHPQMVENGYLQELDTHWGSLYVGGPPWSFEKTPASYFGTSIPGEHTRELFEEFGLTLDEERVEAVPDDDSMHHLASAQNGKPQNGRSHGVTPKTAAATEAGR